MRATLNEMSLSPTRTVWPLVSDGRERGLRLLLYSSIHGWYTKRMNVNGITIMMRMIPDTSTMMENSFPISLVKVMSPNPNVDMTVSVQ